MSKLKQLREARNLTQEELARISTISVRTIQRIEAGTPLRGQTLKLLARALDVTESELLDNKESAVEVDLTMLKIINLSSLILTVIPPANIIVPLIIMFSRKQFNAMTRQLVSLQIIWTILATLLFLASSLAKSWFSLGNRFIPVVMILLVVPNIVVILRNAAEIDKKGRLYFHLNFSVI
jgi:transcriptional regulator with XRE-family HTH domain